MHTHLKEIKIPNYYNLGPNTLRVSTKGMHGIGEEVFLSLPCVLNSSGVGSVVNMTLTDGEVAQIKKSADTLWGIQKDLKDVWTLTDQRDPEKPVIMHSVILLDSSRSNLTILLKHNVIDFWMVSCNLKYWLLSKHKHIFS